ncbi:uncharacterized protein LOC111602165 [Drosophila hydei]|uniref:Uncharacterized protein LOC111602165 n=1 Tax=Drosophila hydei TaxID=7224 RepID=A0A6J1MD24_DROHY|nr:uncharacterized protein LOC111602165 [Drosophila hydei]
MSSKQLQCELYPRVRNTEYYRSPEPRASIQSRQAEHPQERGYLPAIQNLLLPRVIPAQTSNMRVQRDSYFS